MWFAIAQAIASMVTNTISTYQTIRESRKQAKEISQQYQQKADARAREARTLMSQQKTSFLKGGVYFDTGSPNSVINETYNIYQQDLNAMNLDSTIAQKRLIRQGNTAFWNYVADPLGDNGKSALSGIFQQTNSSSASSYGSNSTTTKMSGGPASSKLTNTKLA